jgi:hypothetical protein
VAKRQQSSAKRDEYRYNLNGSAALQPEVQPQQEPRKEREGKRQLSRAQIRRQQKLARMQVREQGAVAPLSVIGMVAVAVLAAFVICLRVQLNTINDQLNECTTTLSQLEKEENALLAQYEQTFDMSSIETHMMASGMSKPTSNQSVYLELSEPDNAVIFQEDTGIVSTIRRVVSGIVEYFR